MASRPRVLASAEPLITELKSGLRARNRAVVERGAWLPKDEAIHVIVRVFSEHPTLLEPEEQASWRAVSESRCERLGEAVANALAENGHCAVSLRVWGYALTKDGSMLSTPTGIELLTFDNNNNC